MAPEPRRKLALEPGTRSAIVRVVYRGRRAQEFMRTMIWKDIEDYLAERQTRIAEDSMRHGEQSVDAVAMRSAECAGRFDEASKFQVLLDRWIKEGQEAQTKLKELGIEI